VSGHKPVINRHQVGADRQERFYVTCTCRSASPLQLRKQEAEDWQRAHLENVQRALANLHRGRGSLTTDMEHAKAMMDDPRTSKRDRATWKVIYDGARQRLGVDHADDEQQQMW
jgi:hypothetical protein